MLKWALIFAVVAVIAGALGFGGIAGAAAGVAKLLFIVAVIGFLLFVALGLAADGVGQLLGYLAGSGGSPGYLTGFEFGRVNFVPEDERLLWLEPEAHSETAGGESAGGVSSPASR